MYVTPTAPFYNDHHVKNNDELLEFTRGSDAPVSSTVPQSQKAVTAYFTSKQFHK